MWKWNRSRVARYAGAVLAAILAIALRLSLNPWLGDRVPFLTLLLGVLIVAGYAGRGPALLTTAVGALGAAYLLLPPQHSLRIGRLENRIDLGMYLTAGIGIAGLGGALRAARLRAEAGLNHATEQREQLRIALDAARMAAWEWDPVGEGLSLTDQAGQVLGLVPGSPHGNSIKALAILHPDDAPAHQRTIQEALKSGQSYHTRFRIIRPVDGQVAWIEEWGQIDNSGGSGQKARLRGVLADITDRMHVEEEAKLSRSRLETVLTASEIGIWEYDATTDLVRGDSNFARMFGVSLEEVAGAAIERFAQAIHPDDRAHVKKAFRHTLATGADFETEYRLVVADNPLCWLIARGRARRDETGKIVALPGVTVDVTKQKQAEEELRAAQSRLDSTLSAAEVGSWEFDIVHNRVHADRNLARLFGVSLQEANGGPLEAYLQAIHPEDQHRVGQAISQAMESEDSYEAGYRIVGPDGLIRSVVARGRIERDAEGRPTRLPGVVIDITKQREAEDRLRESESKFRTLFNTMDEGFCVIEIIFDADERPIDFLFLEMNPAFSKHAGIPDAVGKTMRQIAPDHEMFWFETYGHVALTGESIRFEHQAQALEHRWFDVYAFRLGNAASRKVAVLFNDVSVRKHAEAERSRLEHNLRQIAADLSEADRRKDEFLATLAHELRNPLAPIRNGLEIMKLAGDDREAIDESRGLMERQVAHMVRLIDDLMDVSRITRNKLELRRERVDLATVIRNAVETSRPLVEASGHELTVALPDRPILVDADVVRLAQVFSNLLNNAAKYTERGGNIALSAERQGSDVVVAVRDNGVGIPAEMLPEVFAMFTQVDRSLERSQGGLGIGLSLVKTLVTMHGGSVEAHSQGHGLGSEFLVRLPVVLAGTSKAPSPRVSKRSAPSAHRFRILVVDDNVGSATTLSRLLKILGHEAQTAFDGGEAVETAETYRPELIFLDIGLPVLNGYDVARAIRALPWGRDVAIIALTGWGQEGDRRRSHEAGIDDHLVKPVDPATLENLLANLKPEPTAAPPPA